MKEILEYFTNISDEARGIFLVSGLLFFFLLEFGLPLFRMDYNKWKHARINITFTIITLIVNLFGAILILAAVRYNETHNSGLLNLTDLPLWLYVLGGLVLMDLIGAWFIHWVQHNVRWLWKFHIIHHTDPNVDAVSYTHIRANENSLQNVIRHQLEK